MWIADPSNHHLARFLYPSEVAGQEMGGLRDKERVGIYERNIEAILRVVWMIADVERPTPFERPEVEIIQCVIKMFARVERVVPTVKKCKSGTVRSSCFAGRG